jgi:hypothetical protein
VRAHKIEVVWWVVVVVVVGGGGDNVSERWLYQWSRALMEGHTLASYFHPS